MTQWKIVGAFKFNDGNSILNDVEGAFRKSFLYVMTEIASLMIVAGLYILKRLLKFHEEIAS